MPLDALVDALLERATPTRPAAGFAPVAYPRGLEADDAPITPSDIVRAVNDLFARHGPMPIAADIGDCLFTAIEIGPVDLVGPGYYAGMGFGVPAGIGLQVASGRRPLVLVGDGAFQMTGWELGNCRRYGWDPIVVLFNNASWEMLRAFQPEGALQRARRVALRRPRERPGRRRPAGGDAARAGRRRWSGRRPSAGGSSSSR